LDIPHRIGQSALKLVIPKQLSQRLAINAVLAAERCYLGEAFEAAAEFRGSEWSKSQILDQRITGLPRQREGQPDRFLGAPADLRAVNATAARKLHAIEQLAKRRK
jgi:hypothetical protein